MQLRDKITKIVAPHGDGRGSTLLESESLARRLTWYFDFKPISPTPDTESSTDSVSLNRDPPRVLEIGCSDGSWCMRFKKEQPNWIVEGVDDTNQWVLHSQMAARKTNRFANANLIFPASWSCVDKDLVVRYAAP
jgi:tRNA G46 methylase TrmB